MNWRLVLRLSLFGLAMALGTVFFIPPSTEPVCWLIIFMLCAYFVARYCNEKWFLNGLAIGIVNSVWVTSAHILFFGQYIFGHAKEAAMMKSMPLPNSPRLMMALTGPLIGIVTGTLIGVMSMAAARVLKRNLRRSARNQ